MQKLHADPMAYTPPQISAQVSVRIAIEKKNLVEGIRRCWNIIARVKGENLDDQGKEVELEAAHVLRTTLERGLVEEAAALTGGAGFPALDDAKAWKALEEAIAAGIAKSIKSR